MKCWLRKTCLLSYCRFWMLILIQSSYGVLKVYNIQPSMACLDEIEQYFTTMRWRARPSAIPSFVCLNPLFFESHFCVGDVGYHPSSNLKESRIFPGKCLFHGSKIYLTLHRSISVNSFHVILIRKHNIDTHPPYHKLVSTTPFHQHYQHRPIILSLRIRVSRLFLAFAQPQRVLRILLLPCCFRDRVAQSGRCVLDGATNSLGGIANNACGSFDGVAEDVAKATNCGICQIQKDKLRVCLKFALYMGWRGIDLTSTAGRVGYASNCSTCSICYAAYCFWKVSALT